MQLKHALVAIALVGSTLIAALAPSLALAQNTGTFTLVNDARGYTITNLYVSPATSKDWGPDILKTSAPYGASITVTITNPTTCVWDISATDQDGDSWDLFDQDLCRNSTIHFNSDDWELE